MLNLAFSGSSLQSWANFKELILFPYSKTKPLGQFWDFHPYFWVTP